MPGRGKVIPVPAAGAKLVEMCFNMAADLDKQLKIDRRKAADAKEVQTLGQGLGGQALQR